MSEVPLYLSCICLMQVGVGGRMAQTPAGRSIAGMRLRHCTMVLSLTHSFSLYICIFLFISFSFYFSPDLSLALSRSISLSFSLSLVS